MIRIDQPVAAASIFMWIGFVCGISFLEAWLKFRAPGVTLPIGLGIGRLVFSALNKVEWVLAITIAASALLSNTPIASWQNVLFAVVLAILVTQTTWLLPGLDARAQLHIDGKAIAPSRLHIYFVAFETIKVICLVILGIKMLRR